MNINERIKHLRKTINNTQTEFANTLGMTLRGVQKWEHGDVDLKESSLRLIESSFNVNPSWLREGKGEMFVKEYTTPGILISDIDTQALGELAKIIDEFLSLHKRKMKYKDKFDILFNLYLHYVSEHEKQNKVVSLSDYIKKNAARDVPMIGGAGGL